MQSEQINELAAALSKAQGQIKGAVKDSANPFFQSKYADLQSVWEACRVPLSSNGLSILQTMEADEKGDQYIVTTLAHSSGQWISGRMKLNPVKNDPQAVGSCISYYRRYSLAAMVGIYQSDDDAESAVDRSNPVTNAAESVKADRPASTTEHKSVFGSGAFCAVCGTELVVSKSGAGYYCPNFKDAAKGEHTRIKASEIEDYKKNQGSIPEGPQFL